MSERDAAPGTAAAAQEKPQQDGAESTKKRTSWLGKLIGWVVLPGGAASGIVLGGVFVGANYPEMWLVRLVRWITGLFAG